MLIDENRAIAVHEAKKLWPNRKIDCIVSVGTGRAPAKDTKGGFWERTLQQFIESASSPDRIDDLMTDIFPPDVYFRLHPEDSRCNLLSSHSNLFRLNVELDEGRKEKIEDMRETARDYIKANEARFQAIAQILMTKFV